MSDGARNVLPKSCGEPQPANWLNACDLLKKHDGPHRHRLGQDDLVWEDDGPVEVEPVAAQAPWAPEAKAKK